MLNSLIHRALLKSRQTSPSRVKHLPPSLIMGRGHKVDENHIVINGRLLFSKVTEGPQKKKLKR